MGPHLNNPSGLRRRRHEAVRDVALPLDGFQLALHRSKRRGFIKQALALLLEMARAWEALVALMSVAMGMLRFCIMACSASAVLARSTADFLAALDEVELESVMMTSTQMQRSATLAGMSSPRGMGNSVTSSTSPGYSSGASMVEMRDAWTEAAEG